MCPITDEFLEDIGNERYSFRLVQTDAPGKTTLGEETDLGDEKFVDLEIISCQPLSTGHPHPMHCTGINPGPELTSRGTRCIFARSENRDSAAACGKVQLIQCVFCKRCEEPPQASLRYWGGGRLKSLSPRALSAPLSGGAERQLVPCPLRPYQDTYIRRAGATLNHI